MAVVPFKGHTKFNPNSLANREGSSIITRMIKRLLEPVLKQRLAGAPAVGLIGPRQVGKTTLALMVAEGRPSVYLDLESDSDKNKLTEPELYLSEHTDELVILDEVHRLPDIFQTLRGLIDKNRRRGNKVGQYLLLGSASIDLLKQSGESLAGRISYLELFPFCGQEVPKKELNTLWLRGGFPESFTASNDQSSMRWRLDFIRTYLEREVPQFGSRVAAETLRRFWVMCAHHHGQLLNAAQLSRSLGVDAKTVSNYLDLLVDLLLVRRLSPWHRNEGKRLVRSPKIYIRDSGIVHALLGLKDREMLLGHPVVGQSWEGFVIETLLAVAPEGVQASFYRTSAGAEIDLVLRLPDGKLWAMEVKRSLAPKVEKGFHIACEDLRPARRLVIHPGTEAYPISKDIEAISLTDVAKQLSEL